MTTETSKKHESWAEKNEFLIRRLHSLSGLVPLGAFLCVHLLTNASILGGAGDFQKAVSKIHAMPVLPAIEVVGIFLPLLFHSVVGFQIWFSGRPNPIEYRYGSNIRYTLQRFSGGIAFIFIGYHLWQMHWIGAPFGGGRFVFEHDPSSIESARTTAEAIQSAWWTAPFYAVGIIATVYHLANGIWTSLITWGITIKPQTQRVSGYACIVFGILLCGVGLGALRGFKTFNTGGATATDRAPAAITASLDEH